jgi:class 3 adenylate cyclase
VSVLPTGTVTFLFSDIEGSTRLTRELGDDWGDVLAEHRRLMRQTFGAENGREVDTQGDAFFFAFPRARDAVAAAVAAQRAHTADEWPRGADVRVRIGIHTGEPSVGDEGYFGLDVVRAARLCSAAHGGQVLVSGTTRALLGPDAPEGVELRDLGEHRLKDLEYPEHVFQVVAPDLPASFEPVAPGRSVFPAAFAGRERELASEARAVAGDFGRRINEEVQRQIAEHQEKALERLRERGVAGRATHKPPRSRNAETRVITGSFVLAGFLFLVLAAAVVAVLYLLLG